MIPPPVCQPEVGSVEPKTGGGMNTMMEGLKLNRVLIVDDEDQTRRMIERTFKKCWPQIEIAQAKDGIQAVEVAERFLPDLMILDLLLPGQNGFAVLEAFNEHPRLKSTLVLGITGYNAPENIQRLMQLGAISCITKPFGPHDLRRILSPYIEGNTAAIKSGEKVRWGNGEDAQEEEPRTLLVNAALFLALMISGFSTQSRAQGSSSKMSKNISLEEPMKKKNLPPAGTARETAPEAVSLPFKRIAVLPFESWNEYLSGNTLSDYFVHHLVTSFPEVTVVERKELNKILKEQFFSQTGAINPETVSAIGKILGIDAILIGKVTTLDTIVGNRGAISILCRIVDTNTGQILWSDKQSAKLKPRLIQFESNYKSPMEVAEFLIEQVAEKSVLQLRNYFSKTLQARSAGAVYNASSSLRVQEVKLASSGNY